MWDIDEFFIPKGASKSLLDVLTSTEETDPTKLQPIDLNNAATDSWSASHRPGKKGYASGHAHPYCYLQVSSDVVANKVDSTSLKNEELWIGSRFSHDIEPRSSEIAHRYLLTHLTTYSLTHSLTHSPNHLLTHSPNHHTQVLSQQADPSNANYPRGWVAISGILQVERGMEWVQGRVLLRGEGRKHRVGAG